MDKDEIYYSSLKEYKEQELLEQLIWIGLDEARASEIVEKYWVWDYSISYVDWSEVSVKLGDYDIESLDWYKIVGEANEDFIYCDKEEWYALTDNCTYVDREEEWVYNSDLVIYSEVERSYIYKDNAVETEDDWWVSQDNENYSRCRSCEWLYHSDDMLWDERTEEDYCSNCYEELDHGNIHSYGYKPTYVFKWQWPLFLWCEIEVHELHNKVDDILDDEDIFRATEDSSLDNGAEFVSNPMSLEWIHDNIDEFKTLSERIKREWGVTDNKAWLHIHASRAWLCEWEEDAHINRIWDLLHLSENFAVFRKLAGRSPTHYCEVDSLTLEEIEEINKNKWSKPWMSRRYSWLNLQPSNTIEFRMFISTTSWEYRMARFELVHAIIEYTRTKRALSADIFLQRASEQWEKYSWLMRLMQQKDLSTNDTD